MSSFLERSNRFMSLALDARERLLLAAAALLLAAIYVLPLWNLTMFAPQYPEGLRMDIYSYKLEGGHGGEDVREINVLNHYIGMKDLATEDFTEFKWMPFVVGGIALFCLRAAVHGHVSDLVDVIVVYGYFSTFALWSFGYKLYSYGHSLSPTAPVKVPPFMPPMFGSRQLANFQVYSFPGPASYLLALSGLLMAIAFVLARRESRRLQRLSRAAEV